MVIDGFAQLAGAESDELRANLAVYLAGDESSGMTGQTIAISNGMRMH